MKTYVLIGLLVLAIALSGCVNIDLDDSTESNEDTVFPTLLKSITVGGIDTIKDVNPSEPTKLIVSGVDNQINVLNCNVQEIDVSGVDNIISYPRNCNPKINNTGIGNSITVR